MNTSPWVSSCWGLPAPGSSVTLQAHTDSEPRVGEAYAQARAHFAAWADEDHYFPLDAELGALREAGFDEVECFWRRGPSAITCALRAS